MSNDKRPSIGQNIDNGTMKLKKCEKELFENWPKTKKKFVTDGIVNENKWNKSLKKILYILKEANDPDGGGWDLSDFVAKGGKPQTWDNIARWTYGILNLNKEIFWNEIKNISNDFRKEWLQSICVVNLKKVPGGHTTNNNALAKQVEEDKQSLQKQFNLYSQQVDIIICCGTIVSRLFHYHVNDYPNYNWGTTSRGINYHQIGENRFLIEYLHPEDRVGNFDNILFYGLIDAIKEIFKRTLPNTA